MTADSLYGTEIATFLRIDGPATENPNPGPAHEVLVG